MRVTPGAVYTVYAIQCTATKRVYIGSTSNFESRVRQHFSELSRGSKTQCVGKCTRTNSTWQKEYNQYGRASFKVFIVEENIAADTQAERESYYIGLYNASDPRYGYNIKAPRKPLLEYTRGLPEVLYQAT